MTARSRLVLVRPPCEWCASPYKAVPATVEATTNIAGAVARLCDACADLIAIRGDRAALVTVADAADPPEPAEVAAYLEGQAWTFAKSVPNEPHEYLLLRRSWDPAMHLRVIRFIRENGERRRWQRDRAMYSYWRVGDREYWPMGRESETLINRREVAPPEPADPAARLLSRGQS